MKVIKNISLIWLIFSAACAVTNWGGELAKNPVFVTLAVSISACVYAVTSTFDD